MGETYLLCWPVGQCRWPVTSAVYVIQVNGKIGAECLLKRRALHVRRCCLDHSPTNPPAPSGSAGTLPVSVQTQTKQRNFVDQIVDACACWYQTVGYSSTKKTKFPGKCPAYFAVGLSVEKPQERIKRRRKKKSGIRNNGPVRPSFEGPADTILNLVLNYRRCDGWLEREILRRRNNKWDEQTNQLAKRHDVGKE